MAGGTSMRLVIICEDKNIKEARKSAEIIVGNKHLSLNKPLSETGKKPASHWLCILYVNDEMYEKIKSIQKHTIIYKESPRFILDKLNLKKIK